MFDPRLSNLPEDWQLRAVGSLGEIVTGTTPSTSRPEYYDGEIPFVSPGDLDGRRHIVETEKTLSTSGAESARPLPPNAIMISCIGILGKVGQAPATVATNQQINSIVPNQDLDPSFAYWSSHLLQRQLERFAGLQVIPIVNKTLFSNAVLPVPPLPEQRRIAEILDTADAAIQQTEAVIAKLKQVKAGLLHDLLTRGLDENGQLRDPEAHPEQFKETEIGRVPREWRVEVLDDVSEKIQDGTHFSPQSKGGEYRYLTSKNVRFGFLDLADTGWISQKEHDKIYARCDVRMGDVLLTKDGVNTGNAAINTLHEPFSLLSSVAFIRPRPDLLTSKFVLQYILSPIGQKRLTDLMSGLAISRLTLTKIRGFAIPVPPQSEQRRIASALEAHDQRMEAERNYRDKLEQVKRGLMQDLLTGRVRV